METLTFNFRKIKVTYTPAGSRQLWQLLPLTGVSDRQQLIVHLKEVLLPDRASDHGFTNAMLACIQKSSHGAVAGAMLTQRIRKQDSKSYAPSSTDTSADVKQQLQFALVRAGMSFNGAHQIVTGSVLTNDSDRRQVREIMMRQ